MNQEKTAFEFWESPDFDAKNQLTEIGLESFSPSVRFLIVIFMKENKPVITEKHHSHKRDETFLITFFFKVWTIKNLDQGSKSRIL